MTALANTYFSHNIGNLFAAIVFSIVVLLFAVASVLYVLGIISKRSGGLPRLIGGDNARK
jgi:hypothetical protein